MFFYRTIKKNTFRDVKTQFYATNYSFIDIPNISNAACNILAQSSAKMNSRCVLYSSLTATDIVS